jgi:hypothetical protein
MTTARIDKLIWVLIYGGLLILCLGVFVRRGDEALGWCFLALGAFVAVCGAALIWLRSRMAPEASANQGE